MNTDPVIENANRVAIHFAGLPREEAIEGIRNHIRKFWDQPVKDRLIACVAQGGAGLDELVLEAVKRMPIDV